MAGFRAQPIKEPAEGKPWWVQGPCANGDYDPDLWVLADGFISSDNRKAMDICKKYCPVFNECKTDLMLHTRHKHDRDGMIRAGKPSGFWSPWTRKRRLR